MQSLLDTVLGVKRLRLDALLSRQISINRPRSLDEVCFFTDSESSFVKSLRYAEILVTPSSIGVKSRLWPRIASHWDVFWDERFAKGGTNTCRVFFSFPVTTPGFMTVNYFRAGPQTEYRTILTAERTLEEIALVRGCQAIVCQVISKRISERLMQRWGYVPHAKSLGNGHFIRRLKS